jgi:hypothetical protein
VWVNITAIRCECVEEVFSEVGLGCLQDALGPMVSVMLPLRLAIHPAAQQAHQDVKDKVSRSGTESCGIEARLRKKRPRRVLYEFSEAVDGSNNLISGGLVAQAEYHDVSQDKYYDQSQDYSQ